MTHDQRATLLAIVRGDIDPTTLNLRDMQRLQLATHDTYTGTGTVHDVLLDILKGLTIPSRLSDTARTRLIRTILL